MGPLPWSCVNSWYCSRCGLCCKEFEIVLRFDEWLNLVSRYGMGVTKAGVDRLYLGKKSDGTCMFLYGYQGGWLCGLQPTKPMACKLWPFKISNKPRFGRPREAEFNYHGRRFYVYVDPYCPEIRLGNPSDRLARQVIPEVIEIASGSFIKQAYSTSSPDLSAEFFQPMRRGWRPII